MSEAIQWPLPPIVPVDSTLLALPEGQYVRETHEKKAIVLHHTVGGSAISTFNWWNRKGPDGKPVERVGTAFLVDRDGTIYQCFDPKYWAFHLGLKGTNGAFDKTSIGIELCSEGGLVKRGGVIYNQLGAGRPHKDDYVTLRLPWRGYHYFDAYEPEQIVSTVALVHQLLEAFPTIPRAIPSNPYSVQSAWLNRGGVYGHSHVRADKSDVHPLFPWAMLASSCRLEEV